MTVGSETRDYTTSYAIYRTYFNGGGTVSDGFGRLGRKTTKVWSGGDDPPARPIYETKTFFLRYNGKVRKVRRKIRVGATSRVKRSDHNYTMTRLYEENLPYVEQTSVYVYNPSPGFQGYRPESLYVSLSKDSFGTIFDYTGLWNSNDQIALLGRLRTQVAGSDFNAGVVLAELNQSLGMIFNAATRIRKAIKALLKGRPLIAARELGVPYRGRKRKIRNSAGRPIADQWLELSYGWVPLLNDAKSGAEFLAHLFSLPLKQTYRARLKKEHKVSILQTFTNTKVVSYETGQIIARVEEVDIPMLSGLTDIASILHEKTPWSFVADWFIPIGNYLSARGLARSLKGTFTTTKTFYQYVHYDGRTTLSAYPYRYEPLEGPDYTKKYFEMTRSVSTTLDVPMPRVKPLADVPSWKRTANAVALLVQKIF